MISPTVAASGIGLSATSSVLVMMNSWDEPEDVDGVGVSVGEAEDAVMVGKSGKLEDAVDASCRRSGGGVR